MTRVAVLVSGGGRSLENLVDVIAAGKLDATVGLVLSDRPGVGALERAARHELPSAVLRRKEHASLDEFSAAVFAAVEEHGCEFVVMAGFLSLVRIPERWVGRVINIHPSLLPAFGGKGYYGDRVHAAVLEKGVWFSGCTVHFVDNEYDSGPIILQRAVEVRRDDTVETLAARVFDQEKIALPAALADCLAGRVRFVEGRAQRSAPR